MKKEKQTVSGTRVMRLNRFLGTKYGILCICILEDLLLFFLAQYITNVILRFPEWLRDLDHPELYIGIRQFFPDINLIAEHPVTKWIYLGIVLLMLIVDAVTVYQFKVAYSEEQLNQGQKGVSRWTTNEEIKAQYTEIPDRDLPFPGHGGTIVSRIGKKLYIDDSLTNNLIIGITRSGKGEMFVVPSIDVYSRAEEKTSMVITDPKLELFKMSKSTLEEVELDISNQKFDGENTYRFTALETNAGPLKVKPILEEMDWVILQIEGIPEKFAEISLRMEMEDDETAGVVKMYTNVNEVARVNAIEKKDRNGYLAQRYEQEILGYESEIREWNGKIVEAEDKISTIEQEIQEMKAKEEYQTDAQIEDTENMISEAQNEILATEEAIVEYEVDIKERQQRIQNVQLQLNELKQE